jgi:hypothetical protein
MESIKIGNGGENLPQNRLSEKADKYKAERQDLSTALCYQPTTRMSRTVKAN